MAPPLDLKDLRNLSKRDPSGYHAEFVLQYRHFQTQLQIFLLKPSEDYKPFSDLVEYLCHVSDIYSKDMPDFPEQISNLLEKNCDILASPLRRSLVSALILLRSKNQITPHNVLSLFFKLFRCKDAGLREMLYKHIVNDITNINKKHKNQNLNHALQNFMFTMMKDPNEMAAKQSLNVMIELYRKKVWNDPKTVNVISTGIFSGVTAVVVSTLKFFLTVAADDEEDRIAEHKEQAKLTIKKMNLKLNVKKMGHGARDRAQKAIVDANESKTVQRKLDPNWPAIELINDPQGYAEKVFGVARHSFERAEVRLMLMNFISRLIFTHKLIILNFYPFVQRYLMPKNEHVTYALSILAQSVHELIPPTDLQPLVKHLVDKFVHDRSANESIVAGLHTLREMANRNPLIMNEGLVRDLSMYKNYKDKAVTTAARGLIGVYRVHNPSLLEKRDRGKEGSMNKEKPLEYGEVRASSGVSDIELLQRIKMIEQQERLNKSKRIASEVDLEGNIIAYESEEEDDDEEDGEDDEDDEDDEGEDGEGELMEVSDEEADSDESDESEVEEVTFTKKMKKGSAKKGGVVPTEGVMSIAEALKLEKMQREAIEQQRAKQLSRRDKRKRGEQYEDEEEEEEEEEDDEDEDEDEDDDDEEEDEGEAEPEPIAEPEIDIFAQIEMAADDSVTVINHPKPKKVEKVLRMVYQPPMKQLRTEEEEVDSEDSDQYDEEMEEVQVAKQTNKKKPVKSVPVEANEAEPKLDLEQPIDLNMILTEEDFVRLAKLREMKADGKISLTRLRNLSRDLEEQEEDSDEEDSNGVVDPSSLLRGIKNRKDKEELLKESQEKRENREKRTKIKLKRTTNEEKTKFKNLMMIMKGKKTYAKGMRSFSERQVAMQKGKVKFAKRKHK